MASNSGEERVLTVFADVHYFFNAPTSRPLSHRFEKASYLYLHQRTNPNGCRLEIANNVGTPEQDAFTGALDTVTIRQIEEHQTLVTVTADAYRGGSGVSPSVQYPEHYWQLPKDDPESGSKNLFRLHTLDIYFWTVGDANSFVAILRKLLRPEQLNLPPAIIPQEQIPSPVVQRLETLAIQDTAYHDGQTSNSNPAIASSIPQPNAQVTKAEIPKAVNPENSTNYQLLAYNPASPPAPEKIAHREKTPPPPDAGSGTGLAIAAYQDQSHSSFSATSQSQGWTPNVAYGQPPGPHGYIKSPAGQAHRGSYNAPAPQPGYPVGSPQSPDYRNPSVSSSQYVPPVPYTPSSNPYKPGAGYTPSPPAYGGPPTPYGPPGKLSFDGPPKDPTAHLYGTDPKPPDSPATEILGNSYVTGAPPLQHLQPQYADYLDSRRRTEQPEGGYSNYSYDQPHHHSSHSHSNKHSVHEEWYTPTEAEAHKHKHQRPAGQPAGKLEQRAEKVEKGIGRLLKKVEKKIG